MAQPPAIDSIADCSPKQEGKCQTLPQGKRASPRQPAQQAKAHRQTQESKGSDGSAEQAEGSTRVEHQMQLEQSRDDLDGATVGQEG